MYWRAFWGSNWQECRTSASSESFSSQAAHNLHSGNSLSKSAMESVAPGYGKVKGPLSIFSQAVFSRASAHCADAFSAATWPAKADEAIRIPPQTYSYTYEVDFGLIANWPTIKN